MPSASSVSLRCREALSCGRSWPCAARTRSDVWPSRRRAPGHRSPAGRECRCGPGAVLAETSAGAVHGAARGHATWLVQHQQAIERRRLHGSPFSLPQKVSQAKGTCTRPLRLEYYNRAGGGPPAGGGCKAVGSRPPRRRESHGRSLCDLQPQGRPRPGGAAAEQAAPRAGKSGPSSGRPAGPATPPNWPPRPPTPASPLWRRPAATAPFMRSPTVCCGRTRPMRSWPFCPSAPPTTTLTVFTSTAIGGCVPMTA